MTGVQFFLGCGIAVIGATLTTIILRPSLWERNEQEIAKFSGRIAYALEKVQELREVMAKERYPECSAIGRTLIDYGRTLELYPAKAENLRGLNNLKNPDVCKGIGEKVARYASLLEIAIGELERSIQIVKGGGR